MIEALTVDLEPGRLSEALYATGNRPPFPEQTTAKGSKRRAQRNAKAPEAGVLTRGKIFVLAAIICFLGVPTMAADGLTSIRSSHWPNDTMNSLEAAVKAKGLTVFARIDHAAGAAAAGLPLRPTEVLIFGNAKGGTPLMQAEQTIGIDLPLKVLVWEDASGATWISYSDPSWLAKRHGIGREAEAAVNTLSKVVAELARTAAAP